MEPTPFPPLNADLEFRRLLDLIPASARMTTTLVSQPRQSTLLTYSRPWFPQQTCTIGINLKGWTELPTPQRDLLLLYAVSWQRQSQWLQPSLYQGIALAGLVGAGLETLQQNALGVVATLGLSAIAIRQVWQQAQGVHLALAADQEALEMAQRRGYTKTEAAQHLREAIATSTRLEHRKALSFNELMRTQQLQTLAGVNPTRVSKSIDTPNPTQRG